MKNVKKDLQAVTKQLKGIQKKAKVKAAKKAPAKKKPLEKKKGATLTATGQVVNIIKRSKKGVDAPALMKKTGLADNTLRNILFRAGKQGKIKKAGSGYRLIQTALHNMAIRAPRRCF